MQNTIFITGRLTKDPIQRTTAQGKTIVNFSIAESRGKDKTVFWDCTAWETQGENILKYCKKGDYMPIVGTIDYNEKDGKRYYSITVRQFDFPPKAKPQTMQEVAGEIGIEFDDELLDINGIVTPF